MTRICAGCKKEGFEYRLGPDVPGKGVSHGLCRYHELLTLEEGRLITAPEAKELLVMRAAKFRKPTEAVVKLMRDYHLSFRDALTTVKRALGIAVAVFLLSGCAGMNQFLTAWGEQPRLEVDNANGGYIRRGDWK